MPELVMMLRCYTVITAVVLLVFVACFRSFIFKIFFLMSKQSQQRRADKNKSKIKILFYQVNHFDKMWRSQVNRTFQEVIMNMKEGPQHHGTW